MSTTSKTIAAVVFGAVTWAVLWVGGAAIAQGLWPQVIQAGQRVDDTTALLGYIAYSVIVSIVAGYLTARIASGRLRAVHILAALQLVLGTAIEISGWHLAPAWYHIVFLLLLVPAIIFGGRLVARRIPETTSHLATHHLA